MLQDIVQTISDTCDQNKQTIKQNRTKQNQRHKNRLKFIIVVVVIVVVVAVVVVGQVAIYLQKKAMTNLQFQNSLCVFSRFLCR